MNHDRSGNDSSPPRQWKRMLLVVALKTEVIVNARYRRRSDAECRAMILRTKPVKP